MSLFKYIAFDRKGKEIKGTIDSHSKDSAVSSLQERGYIVSSIKGDEDKSFLERSVTLGSVKNKDVVVLSKQLSTLFSAQISAVRIFKLIGEENENDILRKALVEISSDISDGSSVNKAMSKHPKIFSDFYVNMIAAGEESGKMSETFEYLSDYLERSYEMTSKVKSALIYPSFVIVIFFAVMYLMLTTVIPKISEILVSNGGDLPLATEVVIGMSNFLVNYGLAFLVMVAIGIFFLINYIKTKGGREAFDTFKLNIPLVGSVYKEMFLSRISGNISLMLSSGVSMIKTLDNTAKVVDNVIYEKILTDISEDVKGGKSLSDSFSKHENFSSLFVQMVKVGEESGKITIILDTLSNFYEKEVLNKVKNLISLIEPIMITALGGGVGLLLSAVLLPIYNVSNSSGV